MRTFGLHLFLAFVLFMTACASGDVKNDPKGDGAAKAAIAGDDGNKVNVLFRELEHFIGERYFDIDSKPIIKVFMRDVSVTGTEEAFGAYIKVLINERFEKAPQFELVDTPDTDVDAIVGVHVIPHRDTAGFDVLNTVIEPSQDSVVFASLHDSRLDEFEPDMYVYFKQRNWRELVKPSISHLTVKAIIQGKSIKEKDRYGKTTTVGGAASWGSSGSSSRGEGSSSYSSKGGMAYSGSKTESYGKVDMGFNSWYPAEIELVVNNKPYTKDQEGMFFNGTVKPGRYEFIASFKEGMWDAYNRYQSVGKRHRKKALVAVRKGEHFLIDIFFNYDGETYEPGEKDIVFKAYKLELVNNQMKKIPVKITEIEMYY